MSETEGTEETSTDEGTTEGTEVEENQEVVTKPEKEEKSEETDSKDTKVEVTEAAFAAAMQSLNPDLEMEYILDNIAQKASGDWVWLGKGKKMKKESSKPAGVDEPKNNNKPSWDNMSEEQQDEELLGAVLKAVRAGESVKIVSTNI